MSTSDRDVSLLAISHDLFAVRKAKLAAMREEGQNPYAENWSQTHTSKMARDLFESSEDSMAAVEISLAGRMVAFRLMGKASFVKILDREGTIQLYLTQQDLGEEAYQSFKKYDLGDFLGVLGVLFRTKTGEITVRVHEFRLISKALRPLPEKWHGLAKDEQIYRQRYLDIMTDENSRNIAILRTEIIREIRQFLWKREFREFETPFLQNVAGGAAARPFVTHMNALDCDFYLRISLELYLKRMLIAGFERVFEIGRVFRNEGLSRKHNPEFTMLELYQAYTDYRGMMVLVYELIQYLCHKIVKRTTFRNSRGHAIELGGVWREVTYRELIQEFTGDAAWFSRSKAEKLDVCAQLSVEVREDAEDFELTHAIYSKLVEPSLIQPTFVTQLPKELCPLAKINPQNPSVLDVFELCINGQEIAPAYSEQNDPLLQRELFEQQMGEDRQNLDNDFLYALEYGMPPAGGIGIGIDRLVVLFAEVETIRDVILFPSMRPVMDQ